MDNVLILNPLESGSIYFEGTQFRNSSSIRVQITKNGTGYNIKSLDNKFITGVNLLNCIVITDDE